MARCGSHAPPVARPTEDFLSLFWLPPLLRGTVCVDRGADGRTDGWMDGWMDGGLSARCVPRPGGEPRLLLLVRVLLIFFLPGPGGKPGSELRGSSREIDHDDGGQETERKRGGKGGERRRERERERRVRMDIQFRRVGGKICG